MPAFSRLELENFKSYRSHTVIEWKQVSSILGQNGTGKSTIIDAIEYVFCFPRYAKKTAKTLKQELYNNESNDNEHSSTWVNAIVNIDNEERVFKRATNYKESTHKYWVNDRAVNLQEYTRLLIGVNINPHANNFLVQQNTIETLGLLSARQRSEFFEKLSGSITYKSEYDRLLKDMQNIQSEVVALKKNLDLHKGEKKNLTKKNEQIKLYDELLQEFKQVEFDYYYIKLYEIQTNIDQLHQQKQEKEQFLNKNAKLVKEFDEKIQKYKAEIKEKEQQITDIQTNLEHYEPEILEYERTGAELTDKIKFCQAELKKVANNLEVAKNIDRAHEQTLEDLRKQASEIEKTRNEFDEALSQSCSIELDDKQYKKYLRLKEQVQKQFAVEIQHILTLERERNNIKDKINEYEAKEKDIADQIEREQLFLKKIYSQKDNVNKKIVEAESNIKESVKKSIELDVEIQELNQEVENTIKKIQEYNDQLSDFDAKQEERSHRHRLREISDTLKEWLPSRVLGQLSRLCELTNKEKYGIAITQILGNNMDGIVVDTADTARECITFLKERYKDDTHSAVATFFPLDNCPGKTLSREKLKHIELLPYAKLAVDVMKPGEIGNVLQQLLGHIVICETDDQAMELSTSLKLNCVSLSGIYYKKNGTFSGGQRDIKEKAKKWKQNDYPNIEAAKEKETENLRSTQRKMRETQNSKTQEQEKQLSWRRRLDGYFKPELKRLNEEIKMKENNLQKLKNKLDTLQKSKNEIEELRESLSILDRKLSNYKQREYEIEDAVFSKFCKKFHLENIRKYEEGDFRKHKERINKRAEYDDQLCRIKNEILAEESRDTKAIIKKLEHKETSLKKEEKKLLEKQESWKKLDKKYEQRTASEGEMRSIRCDIDKIRKKLAFEERKLKAAKADMKDFEMTIASMSLTIGKLQRVEIHQILAKCKVKDIKIPLVEGTIKNMVVRSKILDTESESNGQQTESESAIHEKNVEIDFSELDESIKNLDENGLTVRLNDLVVRRKELKRKIESCLPTNRDLERELESIEAKIKNVKVEIKAKQDQHKTVREEFEKVKNRRIEYFMVFCDSVEKEIDGTFKSLYNDAAAQAAMIVENPEEPYNGGIGLSFLIPRKKFTMIEHLSGGEKSMCAMALFLAIYNAKPAPCIIFDEIDAALDNANLQNIVKLFLKWKQTTQIISISHHECLFRCSDAAIGINRSARQKSSYAIHVDLTRYLQRLDIDRTLAVHHGTPAHSRRETTSTTPQDNTASSPPQLPSLSSSSRRTTVGEPQYASTPKSKKLNVDESEQATTPKSMKSTIGEPQYASTPSSDPNSIIGNAQHSSRTTGKIIIKNVETVQDKRVKRKRKSKGSEETDS